MTATLNGFCGSENIIVWRAIRKILCDWKSAARDAFSLPFGGMEMARKGCLLHWRKVFEQRLPLMDSESGWKAPEKGSLWEIDSFLMTFRSLSDTVKGNIRSKTFMPRKRNMFRAISTSRKGREKVHLSMAFLSYKIFSFHFIFRFKKAIKHVCLFFTTKSSEKCRKRYYFRTLKTHIKFGENRSFFTHFSWLFGGVKSGFACRVGWWHCGGMPGPVTLFSNRCRPPARCQQPPSLSTWT